MTREHKWKRPIGPATDGNNVVRSSEGSIQVAEFLVKEATLNKDQRSPVALIAHDMHDAWVKQGCPERMSPVGRILRMLLIGGGGCGKSRIINLVLTALFVQYWGPRGCVKAAPSNKAARGILGKTLHVVECNESTAHDSQPTRSGVSLESMWGINHR